MDEKVGENRLAVEFLNGRPFRQLDYQVLG
jgi:hypothetical protein